MIRGIPAADSILENVSIGETQAFADTLAANIIAAQPEALVSAPAVAGVGQGAFYCAGGHVIIGIPRADTLLLEK